MDKNAIKKFKRATIPEDGRAENQGSCLGNGRRYAYIVTEMEVLSNFIYVRDVTDDTRSKIIFFLLFGAMVKSSMTRWIY